jgi:hypothetical protein
MRFLCLGYHDEQAWSALPAGELKQLMDETFAYERVLRDGGHVLDTKGLQSARSAATLRFAASGELSVTDGPFAETKEQIGGLMVLQADDLQHAVRLLSKMPCMRIGGSLEIRPLNEELSS